MTTTEILRLTDALAGRYAIGRELGAGGMATVYLARDVKHEREVAVKVLHPDLAAALGAERFLAEIRTTANLQHPHILPLHDSGEAGGQLFYVMPFVPGETLRARLDRERQLPLGDALRLTREVLSALDYAHRRGVVHRDVKPENVLLQDGAALVADFGIALAVQQAGGARMTQTGLSLGTPSYMSPEQAMGERSVDARSDVYAVGAMLYEMLTGEPPFTGATVQAIVAKVMTERPMAPSTVRDTVPAGVEAAVLQALAKLPADRFASAAQFADALERGAETTVVGRLPAVSHGRRAALPWAVAGVSTLAALALGGVVVARARRAPADVGPIRFAVEVPPGVRPVVDSPQPLAVSADGRRFAFVGDSGGVRRVYVRTLGDFLPRVLPRTEGALNPSLSPDGRWVLYQDGLRLMRVGFDGGPVSVVADSVGASVGWASDSEVVAPRAGGRRGLSRFPLAGGRPTTVTRSDSAHGMLHSRPVVLDDGETVLFVQLGPGAGEDDFLAIGSLRSGAFTVTSTRALKPLGVVDGRVLYVRPDGAVMAATLDAKARRLTGEHVVVGDPMGAFVGLATTLSAGGALFHARGASAFRVVRLDPAGKVTSVLEEPGFDYGFPSLSPDGQRLAVAGRPADGLQSGSAVRLVDLTTGAVTRLTTGSSSYPFWSPDGRQVTFSHGGSPDQRLAVRDADLRDDERPVPTPRDLLGGGGVVAFLPAPDGRTGVMVPSFVGVLYAVDTVDRTTRVLTPAGVREAYPRLSPDGRWLAFTATADGRADVFVRPYPGPGPRVQISSDGGTEPVWSRDGRRIYYRAAGSFVVASLSLGSSLGVASRAVVAEDRFVPQGRIANYDVARDGSLYVVQPTGGADVLTVTVNWLAEVRAKLAGAR